MGDDRPCNPDASAEVRNVLDHLDELRGRGVVLGQHTQTRAQEELAYIARTTGRLPALCGFELLAYSPNIDVARSGEACLTEVEQNRGTLEQAWQWAERQGLLHLTWHWFSPLHGSDAEIGPMADLAALEVSRVPWTFLMTWSQEWTRESTTDPDVLRAAYHSPYAVTLDTLPALS